MRFSIGFAAATAAACAIALTCRSVAGAAAAADGTVVATSRSSSPSLPPPPPARPRRLEDGTCSDRGTAYAACLSGLGAGYQSCVDCIAAYEPTGGSGGSSFNDCASRHAYLCALPESCPCGDPCLEEYSAYYTCYIGDPGCTISCGGGGGGSSSSGGSDSGSDGSSTDGGGDGGGNSGSGGSSGGEAARQHRVAALAPAVTAVAWWIFAQ
jgi:hypothetical protein